MLEVYPFGKCQALNVTVALYPRSGQPEALQTVPQCSLNVKQRLMQLYLLLRVHFTPARLFTMGVLDSPLYGKSSRDHVDLIHLTWRCSKLHLYWTGVMNTINSVFKTSILLKPKPCLLGILDDFKLSVLTREAVARVVFQAQRVKLEI